ncbi:hypothetical protein SDC9_112746 [bioreactor metagenome]|uniref:Secretion system C-terminal sorting domain-containing protein n=1 Tax=bioreactor metagenome TaxID=1076179 RepID=A0A645BKV9_9ZZZZ
MAFANIETGYLVSGHRMYRIPFVGDIDAGFYDGLNNPEQNIKFSANGAYVKVYSPVKTISDIIITSISGQTVFQQNNNNSNEITLNTSSLNKGFYIFQINLNDNTEWSVKWIKH